ncbi:hypothetical protein IT397_01945 [Candidatus Nomurabacteria bacterium]|nr:hypothetical protein [Candidatus Nomurabacteria bacterium]
MKTKKQWRPPTRSEFRKMCQKLRDGDTRQCKIEFRPIPMKDMKMLWSDGTTSVEEGRLIRMVFALRDEMRARDKLARKIIELFKDRIFGDTANPKNAKPWTLIRKLEARRKRGLRLR